MLPPLGRRLPEPELALAPLVLQAGRAVVVVVAAAAA